MCRLTERALGRRGFVVSTASNADAGLALIRAETFDLVAIDNHMPGKSGRQMLDEIVALEDHPPVVFVTGNDDTAVAVDALRAGALDFVVKTVGDSFFDVLDGRFRQALSRDRLERDKRRAEAELRIANDRLEMLVREVHHRVSNSLQMVLSFVAMQANQSRQEPVRQVLEDIQNRIRAIAKVHQRLYTRDDLTTIDLDAYLVTLADELRQMIAQSGGKIALEVDADHVEVPPDAAVAVGVIVNELVGNAAKYAFPDGTGGTIRIRLERRGDGDVIVCVSDDGRGITEGQAPSGTGLGMRIVGAVARGLGTAVDRVPSDRGVTYCFTVPLNRSSLREATPA
ncbi:response regulator [Altererythrobacter aerius]|uniref:histidine kinase n=2 Tax=Tsuneonella aeria TaxID=1837929 RepID=A0A6I4TCB7_9SPHN|nr:response regulator [Tsuneonella aeria]